MNIIYNRFLEKLLTGSIDILKDTFKIALVNDNYEPSPADQFGFDWLQEQDYELPNSLSYEKGGKPFSFQRITSDSLKVYFRSKTGSITWKDATFTARGAVIYKDEVGKEKTLVTYYDFSENKTVQDADFTLDWAGNYVLVLSVGSFSDIKLKEMMSKDDSEFALTNKAVATATAGLGIRMGKYDDAGTLIVEDVPESATDIAEDLDIISDISDNAIDALFEDAPNSGK